MVKYWRINVIIFNPKFSFLNHVYSNPKPNSVEPFYVCLIKIVKESNRKIHRLRQFVWSLTPSDTPWTPLTRQYLSTKPNQQSRDYPILSYSVSTRLFTKSQPNKQMLYLYSVSTRLFTKSHPNKQMLLNIFRFNPFIHKITSQ